MKLDYNINHENDFTLKNLVSVIKVLRAGHYASLHCSPMHQKEIEARCKIFIAFNTAIFNGKRIVDYM